VLEETPEAPELKAAQRQGLRDVFEKHLGFFTISPGHLLDLLEIDQQAAADPGKEFHRQSGLPMGECALDHDRLAAGREDARVIPLTLDGSDVSREEVQAMLDKAKKGAAKITYVKPPAFADFKKSALRAFEAFASLRKAAPLNDVFANLRGLVDAGHLHPEHYDSLRRELYQDEMIPSLGNKRAYRDFMAGNEAKGGVHVMLDGDGMKAINDTHGHEAGDKAIQSLGNSLRSAIDQSVGQDNAKAHRFGGDEFHFWTKTPEQAHLVLRQLLKGRVFPRRDEGESFLPRHQESI
jgi:GGDEF domain-containing protein